MLRPIIQVRLHLIIITQYLLVTCVQFGGNTNDIVAFAARDGTIYICDAFVSPKVATILRGHIAAVTSKIQILNLLVNISAEILFINENERLISASMDGTARLWDRRTGTCLKVFKEAGVCQSCCLFPGHESLFLVIICSHNITQKTTNI